VEIYIYIKELLHSSLPIKNNYSQDVSNHYGVCLCNECASQVPRICHICLSVRFKDSIMVIDDRLLYKKGFTKNAYTGSTFSRECDTRSYSCVDCYDNKIK